MIEDRVLIVGGGIGGLSLAAMLARRGVEVDLVERAPRFGAVGAGLMLGVNAMRALDDAGCAAEVTRLGHVLDRGLIADARGRVLADLSGLGANYGSSVAIHRARLHEAIASQLDGTRVFMDTSVARLEPSPDGVDAELTDGRTSRYGLVVGADGIRSTVRAMVAPGNEPRYAGYTSWRFVVPYEAEMPVTTEMWGNGRRFGVVPIGSGETYCFATANTPAGERDPDDAVARFRDRFADFGGQVPEILRRLDDAAPLIRTDIDEVLLDRWVYGRVVLVGDAPHAMTPNLGQGAAMAIEDAYVLSRLLASDRPVDDALAEYERVRAPRVRAIADQARSLGRIGQWSSPIACRLRNLIVSLTPASTQRTRMERLLLDSAPALSDSRG
jgi:2-polyprenyl-6-methoxyphenol hydroxylase-like FAD-dependent oxidoreductase